MNHPSFLVKKYIQRKAGTAVDNSVKSYSRAQQGEPASGAGSSHFLKCLCILPVYHAEANTHTLTPDFASHRRLLLLANSWHEARVFGSDALVAMGCHHMPSDALYSVLKLYGSGTCARWSNMGRERLRFMTRA